MGEGQKGKGEKGKDKAELGLIIAACMEKCNDIRVLWILSSSTK